MNQPLIAMEFSGKDKRFSTLTSPYIPSEEGKILGDLNSEPAGFSDQKPLHISVVSNHVLLLDGRTVCAGCYAS